MKKYSKNLLAFLMVVVLSFGSSLPIFARGPENPTSGYLQLEDVTPKSFSVGYFGYLAHNTGFEGHPLQLTQANNEPKIFANGFAAHAEADIIYDIERYNATSLEFFYGVNIKGTPESGSCTFQVYIDGVEVLQDNNVYRPATPHGIANITIPKGAKQIKLIAGSADNGITSDHAVWAEPKLHVEDANLPILSLKASGLLPVDANTQISCSAKTLAGDTIDPELFELTFESNDSNIAQVNASGLVTAKSAGNATITANGYVNGYPVTATVDIATFQTKKTWNLSSPNGKSKADVYHTSSGSLLYSVEQNGETVIELSPIGMNTSLGDFSDSLTFVDSINAVIDETYELVSGKTSTYVNKANESTLSFTKDDMSFDLIFRAYNDGISFRYNIASTDGSKKDITFLDETSAFIAPEDSKATYMPNGGGGSFSHEDIYSLNSVKALSGKLTLPLLYETPGENWVLISEAALTGEYCGSVVDAADGVLDLAFPQQQTSALVSTTPFKSPWRFAVTGEMANIIENTMAENLSPDPDPSMDFSWVKPGVTAWSWMNGAHGAQSNPDIIKKYLDLAYEMGWSYFVLDEGWQPYYGQDGERYKGYYEWFDDIIEYAAERNIGLIAWVLCDDLNTPAKRQYRLAEWAEMGLKGIKVDFFDRENQDRMKLYDDLYQECADLKLVVNCHGANKPTGERRTYPNILTREAIRGEEMNGNLRDQNTILPFIRGVVGPSDYTPRIYPVGGSNITTSQQLALNVLLESGIPCMADSAENYRRTPAYPFLKNLPSAWDETLFINGTVNEYVTIARRSGDKWYIGSANNDKVRTVDVALDFLEDGIKYKAEIYRDGAGKSDMIVDIQEVSKGDSLSIEMAIGGGFGIRILQPNPIESLEFTEYSTTVTEGKSYQIEPLVSPDNYDKTDLLWTSSNESVATVSSIGLVTSSIPGKATIKATAFGNPDIYAEFEITVVMQEYEIDGNWDVVRQNSRLTANNENSITIQSEYGNIGESDSANNIVQRNIGTNDFDMSVKVTGVPNGDYQSYSLVARSADDPKVISYTIRRYHNNFGGNIFQSFVYNYGFNEKFLKDDSTDTETVYLRLKREGTSFTSYYSLDNENWNTIATSTNAGMAGSVDIGVSASNSNSNAAVTYAPVTFENFTLNGEIIPFVSKQKNYVVDVESIEALEVNVGTKFEVLSLPETVSVDLSNGTSSNVAVTWNKGDYSGDVAGTYQLKGTLVMPDNIDNTRNIQASINVIVLSSDFGFTVSPTYISQTKVDVSIDFRIKQAPMSTHVIIAMYDSTGRLVGISNNSVTLSDKVQALDFSCTSVNPATTAKVMISNESFAPLMEAYTIDLVSNSTMCVLCGCDILTPCECDLTCEIHVVY